MRGNSSRKGIAFMLLAALSFSLMAAAIKAASQNLATMEIVFFRGLVSSFLLWLLARSRGGFKPAVNKKGLFARAFFGTTALMAYTYAIVHLDLGLASVLNQSSPIFVAILSIFILRERTHLAVPFFIAMAFVGVVLIVSPNPSSVNFSASLGLLSALLAALAYVFVRSLTLTEHPFVIVQWFAVFTLISSLPLMALEGFVWPEGLDWLWLFLAGLMGLTGQLFMTMSYEQGKASILTPFLHFSVLGSMLLGLLIWQEWPQGQVLAGMAILLLASLGIARLSGRKMIFQSSGEN